MVDPFDVQSRLHRSPRAPVQQLPLELAQPALGRAGYVERPALAPIGEFLLADHAEIHGPDPLGLAVLALHPLADVLYGRHVRAVAREDLVGQRQALGRDHQADADLLAVRPMVAANPY